MACATIKHATTCATGCDWATWRFSIIHPEPGIAGICKVARVAYPDATQFDRDSPYFDPAATRDNPRWQNVDVKFVRKTRLMSLDELRRHAMLSAMIILKRCNRLSITPVTEAEWRFIENELIEGDGA